MMNFIEKKKNNTGFSLLEMLLAMALFFFVSVLVVSVFYSGLKLYKKQHSYRTSPMEIFSILGRMQEELENMVYFDFSRSIVLKNCFEGTAESVSFILADQKGLSVIRYFLLPKEKTQFYQLIRQKIDFSDYVHNRYDENTGARVLARYIAQNGLRLFYGILSSQRKNYILENSWKHQGFPAFIRIEIIPFFENKQKLMRKDVFIPSGYIGGQE